MYHARDRDHTLELGLEYLALSFFSRPGRLVPRKNDHSLPVTAGGRVVFRASKVGENSAAEGSSARILESV